MNARGRVFATGGAGFLGRRVLAALARDGWQVRALVRSAEAARTLQASLAGREQEAIQIIEGDLQSVDACERHLDGGDIVLHMAAGGSGGAAALFSDNVAATRRLMQAVARVRPHRVILVSSFSVYQTSHLRSGDVLDERCPLESRPELRDAYAFSKLAQEQVSAELAAAADVPLTTLRPAVIYGPGRGVLSARVGLSFAGLTFRFGFGRRLPYTYVDNCADAIVRAVALPPGAHGPFNVVDDELPTPAAIVRAIKKAGLPMRSAPLPLWAVRLGSHAYAALAGRSDGMLPPVLTPYRADAQWKPLRFSNAAAKEKLGWRPSVSLHDAIKRSLDWQVAQEGERR